MAGLSNPTAVRDENARKIRAHRKARTGCRNCKLRRVKCDEGTPECRKCGEFGVLCNYASHVPNLQPRYAMSGKFIEADAGSPTKQFTLGQLLCKTPVGELRLLPAQQTRSLLRDRNQIAKILSMARRELAELYWNGVYHLTEQHPFLMYFAQAVSSVHDRYTSVLPSRRSMAEILHYTKGVALFKQKLATPLGSDDRDAIWAAGSMLPAIAFASVEAIGAEEAWPLGPAADVTPEWAKLGKGKVALWELVQPNRPGSLFHNIFLSILVIKRSLEYAPPALLELCEVVTGCWSDDDPYANAICRVFLEPDEEDSIAAVTAFYAFNTSLQGEFGRLVFAKDHRALLILAHWYARISGGQWWLSRRAVLEGQATVLYLDRHAGNDAAVQELLEEPRRTLFKHSL